MLVAIFKGKAEKDDRITHLFLNIQNVDELTRAGAFTRGGCVYVNGRLAFI